MCEILVKAESDGSGDLYLRRGDPVVIMDDGHAWGALEGLPRFYIITLSNVTKAQAVKYIGAQTEIVDLPHGGLKDQNVVRASLYNIEVDSDALTTAQKNTLTTTGRLTLTWQKARNLIRNRQTGLTE